MMAKPQQLPETIPVFKSGNQDPVDLNAGDPGTTDDGSVSGMADHQNFLSPEINSNEFFSAASAEVCTFLFGVENYESSWFHQVFKDQTASIAAKAMMDYLNQLTMQLADTGDQRAQFQEEMQARQNYGLFQALIALCNI